MKDELIALLSEYKYPVIQQGSLDPQEAYPESFFTFWNNSTSDTSHYDNNAIAYTWNFDVNFYSTNPDLVNNVLIDAIYLLRNNGWIVSGRGHDVPSDEITHTGRGVTVLYRETDELQNHGLRPTPIIPDPDIPPYYPPVPPAPKSDQ